MEYLLFQETNEQDTFKLVDKDSDYDAIYRRVNSDKYQEGDRKVILVQINHITIPARAKR